MESRARQKDLGNGAIVAALALIFCVGVTPSARAACPSSFKPKLSGARWSPGAAERQAMARPTVVQAAFESASHEEPIVGLWKVDFMVDGAVIDQAFDAWHADGTETLNDSVSPLAGNVCLGVWERSGHRTYKLKHPSWSYDEKGNLAGMVVINEVVKVNKSGNTFRGTATFDVFDTTGMLVAQGAGEVIGHRITPD